VRDIEQALKKIELDATKKAYDDGMITDQNFLIEYGKETERIRILDILTTSSIEPDTLSEIRKRIAK